MPTTDDSGKRIALLYNSNDERGKKAEKILKEQGIPYKSITFDWKDGPPEIIIPPYIRSFSGIEQIRTAAEEYLDPTNNGRSYRVRRKRIFRIRREQKH